MDIEPQNWDENKGEEQGIDFNAPLDIGLGEAMDVAYEMLVGHIDNHDTPDQLRMRIVAHNLRALAQVLLIADDNPDVVAINLKQVVLGILGTSDWLIANLPSLD